MAACPFMDERLLRHYERELSFLREAGAEFAEDYPKIAATLGLRPEEVTDPSVERLLEGLSFLTARVQLQMEAEFPRFTESLLELVQPQQLLPVPAMAVLQFSPDLQEGSLASGFTLPANSVVRSLGDAAGQDPRCEFRSLRPLTLWPLALESAEYLPSAGLLRGLPIGAVKQDGGALRLRLRTTAGVSFDQLALQELTLFLRGDGSLPLAIAEALLSRAEGLFVRCAEGEGAWSERIDPGHIRQPEPRPGPHPHARSLNSDALCAQLKTFLAFAEGERFVSLGGLGPALRACPARSLELLVVFAPLSQPLSTLLNASHFGLFCVPVINLFNKRVERIAIDPCRHELPLVVDKARPLAYEIQEVLAVHGHAAGSKERQVVLPLYAPQRLDDGERRPAGFYQLQRTPSRVPRRFVDGQRRYRGCDASLVLALEADADLQRLSVEVLCSNRDLPLRLPLGAGNSDFVLDVSAPVLAIRCVAGPSRPLPAPSQGDRQWQVVRQLSRNYLPLAHRDGTAGARALRELLVHYLPEDDNSGHKLLQGIVSLRAQVVSRRLPGAGPVAFGRGLNLTLLLDDAACEGTGTYLFGAALERFFVRYAALNAFMETELRSVSRGHIKTWRARAGQCMIW
ncbi:type VI secretion system baseplate subunit TssF [Pseudomonas sp. FEN]|uniref:type VI secretion system baseplate subunit TssF n=1 Tax=Pseudomonas sp. FEN TaxID=2767468 RepID=UPI001CD4F5DB|nr:type VI secretion system baseplate subunit TssF [Pseudomonas sp. FEN]